ncbi:rab-GTPase-TBC domain-containing protein [Melampsora americana]|nr:rab-GTPase-TBC domain-containing protein [Melampsora americana]
MKEDIQSNQHTSPSQLNSSQTQNDHQPILTHLATLTGGLANSNTNQIRYQAYLKTISPDSLTSSNTLHSLFKSGKGDRKHLWAFILGVDPNEAIIREDDWENLAAHRDEGQVRLDVNRSFVHYPLEIEDSEKAHLRSLLEKTIRSVLRRFPKLSYFQGYHDVVSVFLLTFVDLKVRTSPMIKTEGAILEESKPLDDSENLALLSRVVKRFTLHRIRDSMTTNLDPIMGYLRVTQSILTQEHPRLSSIIAQTSNLPLFSLSWILTLTSHDLTSLEVISRLFDFLLCYNPIMICYIASAICLTKVDQIDELIAEAEEGGEVDFDMDPTQKLDSGPDFESKTSFDDLQMSGTVRDVSAHHEKSLAQDGWASADTSGAPPTTQSHHSNSPEVNHNSASDSSSPDPRPTSPSHQLTENRSIEPNGISVELIIQSALSLYTKYPPTDPRLKIHEILGPSSCLHTWSQSQNGQLSDREAEKILSEPLNRIVLPDLNQLKKEAKALESKRRIESRLRRKRLMKWMVNRMVSKNGLLMGSMIIGLISILYLKPHSFNLSFRWIEIYDRLKGFITQAWWF